MILTNKTEPNTSESKEQATHKSNENSSKKTRKSHELQEEN
jgi:hypothetical protein